MQVEVAEDFSVTYRGTFKVRIGFQIRRSACQMLKLGGASQPSARWLCGLHLVCLAESVSCVVLAAVVVVAWLTAGCCQQTCK
jgi:hypothetical protein